MLMMTRHYGSEVGQLLFLVRRTHWEKRTEKDWRRGGEGFLATRWTETLFLQGRNWWNFWRFSDFWKIYFTSSSVLSDFLEGEGRIPITFFIYLSHEFPSSVR